MAEKYGPEKPVKSGDDVTMTVGGVPFKTNAGESAAEWGKSGAVQVSKEQAQEAAQAHRDLSYVDENWGTAGKFGMGFGSGLTLGLGPGLLAELGLLDKGHIAAAQTSGWYGAGDVAGMLAPALLSGGEAVGARSLLRATPAGLMDLAGNATERLVVGTLGDSMGVLGKAALAPVKMAARGATEAALVSMGHTIGDGLVHDAPLSAQNVLASGLDGALMGGLIGGTLGTVGSLGTLAAESVGKLAKSGAASLSKEGLVARRLGTSSEDLAGYKASEGGYVGHLKEVNEVLESSKTGANLSSSDKTLREAFKRGAEVQNTARASIISDLDKEAGHAAPTLDRIHARIDNDLLAYKGIPIVGQQAQKLASEFKAQLETIRPAMSGKATGETFFLKGVEKPKFEWSQPAPTWKSLIEARDALAKDLTGVQAATNPATASAAQLRKAFLNSLDAEIRDAMVGLESEGSSLSGISKKYESATTLGVLADKMAEQIGKREAQKILSTEPWISARDMAGAAGMTALGHPGAALGWIGAKAIGRRLQQRLEPAIAQAAYESSIGIKASTATENVKTSMAEGMKKFFKTASVTPARAYTSYKSRERAKSYASGVDRESYEKAVSRTEQLISENHQDKVQRYINSLVAQGYTDYAKALYEANQRATNYLIWNMPPRQGTKGLGSLRHQPAPKVPTLQEYKFFRGDRGIKNPLSLIEDLNNGTISRDAVKAVKYVMPEFHKQLVQEAASQIAQMKQEGKALPVQKIVQLGIALDAPIDSILTQEFVGGVQSVLTAQNPGPEPSQGGPQGDSGMSQVAQGMMTPTQQMTLV